MDLWCEHILYLPQKYDIIVSIDIIVCPKIDSQVQKKLTVKLKFDRVKPPLGVSFQIYSSLIGLPMESTGTCNV